MLAYLARYTHRVAISNSRLIALDEEGVTFKWKDYRIKGRDRLRTMTLDAAEFIRRFLLHVLPSGFHRIRHYGLFAGTVRARNIERVRQLLAAPKTAERRAEADSEAETPSPAHRCPCCGGRMIIVETFEGARPARIATAKPDQDRHLMIDIAVLSAAQRRSPSPPAARRSRKTTPSQGRQSFSRRRALRPPLAQSSLKKRSSSTFPPRTIAAPTPRSPTQRSVRDAKIPIARARPTSPQPPRGFLLGRLSNAGPTTRTTVSSRGRRPKPFTNRGVHDRGLLCPQYVDSGRSTRRGQILRASLSLLGDKGLD